MLFPNPHLFVSVTSHPNSSSAVRHEMLAKALAWGGSGGY